MSKERRGIPGVTHPPDETDRPQTNHSRSEPKDHGLGQLWQAPKDIIVTGLRAIAGALTISLARTLGIRDSVSRAEKDLSTYESQLNKRKGNTEKLQEKIDKTKALLTELNKGVELSEAILNIQEDYNELLADDEYLLSSLAKTIGKEGLETIKGSFLTNQKTQVGVKSVTDEEIKLAQEFFARADNDEERSSSLKQHIQQLAETNLIVLGKQLVNLAKIKEIDEINQETNFPINWVSWDEALAASVMGATGRTQESLRGGYGVNMKAGGLNVSAGQDVSQIGPMEQIVVHADIPQNIEAARSVANGEVPLFRSAIIKSLFRKAMGDLSLLPGRIDINNTGNNNTKSYPALDVNRQMNNITLVRKAAIEMQKILKGLEQIDLGKDDDQATQKSKLITVGSRGALAIPRYQVIVDLMEQISATDPGIIANLSEQYRVLEEVADEDLNDQNLDGEADLAEEQQEEQEDQADEDEDQNINQKERDLIEAVFPQGIDQRNARRIINRPKIYFDNFTKRFGLITGIRTMVAVAKEARRLVDTQKTDQNEGDLVEAVFPRGIDQRTARQIIKHPKTYLDLFIKRFGLITGIKTMVAVEKEARGLIDQEKDQEALKLAGYFHGMSIEQAKNFTDNLRANREKLRRMYGTKKGNKTADRIKEFAKKFLRQAGN